MTNSDDLMAQLAEDERVARAAEDGAGVGVDLWGGTDTARRAYREFIDRFDEDRTLREVAAKRKLLTLATAMLETFPADEAARLLLHQSAEEILQQLAEPYTDQGGQES